jgi:hypothetical protein
VRLSAGGRKMKAKAFAAGPGTGSRGRGTSSYAVGDGDGWGGCSLYGVGNGDGRGPGERAANAPPLHFGEGGLSSRPPSTVVYYPWTVMAQMVGIISRRVIGVISR